MQLEPFAAFTLIYLLLNLAVYCVYWWDKQAAIEGGWRPGAVRAVCRLVTQHISDHILNNGFRGDGP